MILLRLLLLKTFCSVASFVVSSPVPALDKARIQLRHGGLFSVIGKLSFLSTERMRVRLLLQAVLTLQDGIYLATAPGSWERSAYIVVRLLGR